MFPEEGLRGTVVPLSENFQRDSAGRFRLIFSQGSLTLIGSTLYGTASGGGANDDGTVFSVPVTGGTPTVLATFNGANGEEPTGGLTLVGSTLYGTTQEGGANGIGTIFSVPLSGGTPAVVASFNGTGNGSYPAGDLMLSGSTLYGATSAGGAYGDGTVFSLAVPEPSSWIEISCGIIMLGLTRRRRARRA
jgi:uncharacterized repeat protein (TIGR03803 family)